MCRICNQYQETVGHLDSRCPVLSKAEYIQRRNQAATYLHWAICRHDDSKVQDKYHKRELSTVTAKEAVSILWDMPIETDKEIKGNRPDIVVKDKMERTCLRMNMSVPTERNTPLKTTEKLSKLKDLEIEIERIWSMQTTTILVVIAALGLVEKGIEKYGNKNPEN